MDFHEATFIKLLIKKNPLLSSAEVAECERKFRRSVSQVKDEMEKWSVLHMKDVVSLIDRLVKELKSIMKEKEECHLLSAVSGGIGMLVGLLSITNPAARFLLLGSSIVLGVGYSIGAVEASDNKKRKLRLIRSIIEGEREEFQMMASAVNRLDVLSKKYFKVSLFSKENREFLLCAAHYATEEKISSSKTHKKKINNFLLQTFTANYFNQVRDLINSCENVATASAMNPFIAAGVQILLLVKEVLENEVILKEISSGLNELRKESEIIDEIMDKLP